jgi:hypothetical protein
LGLGTASNTEVKYELKHRFQCPVCGDLYPWATIEQMIGHLEEHEKQELILGIISTNTHAYVKKIVIDKEEKK